MGPMLVIDIQPAYAGSFGRWFTRDVLERMREVPEDQPIVVVSVNAELSGDDAESISQFWRTQGMDDELFERVAFLEKSYAFFRGWMDNGVPPDEIIQVAREMRRQRKYDSRDICENMHSELSTTGFDLADPLFLPWEMEKESRYRQQSWNICGGGRDECLLEVEIWLESCSIEYSRMEHLTY
jgi:hypothetical protein